MQNIDPVRPPLAVIFGLAGEKLTDEERAFFAQANPLGFILFARNCKDPAQLKALVQSLRDVAGAGVPILIDQEGGRVQRLKPPHWTQYPSAQTTATAGTVPATAAAIAREIAAAGFNVNCAPVLDVRFPETHAALGDRIYGDNPRTVGDLGAAVCRAHVEAGVIPVAKHLPGLGRAALDTHHDLPAVTASAADLTADYAPFQAVLKHDFADAVWGMVSHALYSALDPATPASCSTAVIGGAIRRDIGFDGLLLSDDLSMGALAQIGDAASRARTVLAAGCDVALHCNGNLAEMKTVAAGIPMMTNAAVMRYNRSIACMRGLKA